MLHLKYDGWCNNRALVFLKFVFFPVNLTVPERRFQCRMFPKSKAFSIGTSSGTSNHSPVLNLSQNSSRGGGGPGAGLNSNDASGSEGNYNDGPDDDYTDDDDDDRDQGKKDLWMSKYESFCEYKLE